MIEGNIRFFLTSIKAFQVYDIITRMECRDINEGVVKPSLADVVVVIEWEMLEWLLEDELIIQSDR